MAVGLELRHGIRNFFSPTGAKEVIAKLDSGVYVGSCSIQLRTDLWALCPPQVAKELIAGLSGGGIASPSSPLRLFMLANFGVAGGKEFLATLVPASTSSSSSSSSSGAEESSSSSSSSSSAEESSSSSSSSSSAEESSSSSSSSSSGEESSSSSSSSSSGEE